MWPRPSHVLASLTEASSGPKGKYMLWNNGLEVAFHDLKHVVSAETLLEYTDRRIPFPVHTYACIKQFGALISQTDKHIALFSIKLGKPHHN